MELNDNCEKLDGERTCSGQENTSKASDIRTFFMRKSSQSSEEAPLTPESALKKNSQVRSASLTNSLRKSLKRKRTVRDISLHAPVNKKHNINKFSAASRVQSKQGRKQKKKIVVSKKSLSNRKSISKKLKPLSPPKSAQFSDLESSASTKSNLSWDYYFTPPVSRSSSVQDLKDNRELPEGVKEALNTVRPSEHQSEDEFLYQLAQILPIATEEQLGLVKKTVCELEENASNMNNSSADLSSSQADSINIQQPAVSTETSISTQMKTQDNLREEMEVDHTPKSINLEMVYAMFQKVQRDVMEIKQSSTPLQTIDQSQIVDAVATKVNELFEMEK